MTTRAVRRLYCLACDSPVRVKNEIVDGVEKLSPCPSCNGALVSLDPKSVDLQMPSVIEATPVMVVALNPHDIARIFGIPPHILGLTDE